MSSDQSSPSSPLEEKASGMEGGSTSASQRTSVVDASLASKASSTSSLLAPAQSPRRRRSGAILPPAQGGSPYVSPEGSPHQKTEPKSGLAARPMTRTQSEHASALVPAYTEYTHHVKPKDDDPNYVAPPHNIVMATAAMQGWRNSMEDRNTIHFEPATDLTPPFAAMCIYDGHRGTAAAEYCMQHLHSEVITAVAAVYRESGLTVEKLAEKAPISHDEINGCENQLVEALEDTVIAFEARYREHTVAAAETEFPGQNHRVAGTTAIILVVSPFHHIILNIGDCRCLGFSASGNLLFKTTDHRPHDNVSEIARLSKLGAVVENGRLNGLMVSRSFADFDIKAKDKHDKSPREMALTTLPQVFVLPRVPRADERICCFVAGCDGIWDVKSNEEVEEATKSALLAHLQSTSDVEEKMGLVHEHLGPFLESVVQSVCPSIVQQNDALKLGTDNLTFGSLFICM